ncbi:hypothetical protein [Bradyrhizobium ganzhouense]|uniref:hypothetical protein n=1 Tax=Bradyrhizobium ganzhouense TaxID=1179767 RepID=UPI003CF9E1B0
MASIIRRTNFDDSVAAAAKFCWRAVVIVLLSTMMCAAGDQNKSRWNKSAELKKAGYVELSSDDAVRFLVGNSVLVKKSSPVGGQEDILRIGRAETYYFLNDHTMYDCHMWKALECYVEPWHLEDNEICPRVGACGTSSKIMKAPYPEERAKRGNKIGVYVRSDRFVYDIVKGKLSDGPLFDTRISGRPIELDRAEMDKEIRDATEHGGEGNQISISVPRAGALLIGNTFLSDDAAKLSKDQATNACPKQGAYYSPDGRVIRFTCAYGGAPEPIWTIYVEHWAIDARLFYVPLGGPWWAPIRAIPAPPTSGATDKMLVQDLTNGDPLTGYAGNVLNFRFERHPEAQKSEKQ